MAIFLLNFVSIPIYNGIIKNKKLLVWLLTLQMFLILAFRAETLGVDVDNYSLYYHYYKGYSFKEIISAFKVIGNSDIGWGLESGYVLLNWGLANIGFSFHSFLVIQSAICMLSIGIFIYRYSKNPALSFAMFVGLQGFSYMFGILRQSLALAVLLFAIPALKDRKFFKYLFIIIIAGLFHSTAYLALPLYFVTNFRVKKMHCAGVVFISFIIILTTPFFTNIFSNIMVALDKNYAIQSFEWNNMYLMMLVFALFFALFNYLVDGDDVYVCGFLYGILVQSIAFYVPTFSRVAIGVFLVFLYIAYPNCIEKIKNTREKNVLKALSFLVLLVFYIYCLQSDVNVPYISVFN